MSVNFLKCLFSIKNFNTSFRNLSTKCMVALSNDESMFICWHPEKTFPYEFSKELPRKESELRESESVLKVQYYAEEKNKYRSTGPTQRELMKIFNTTRHAFDPKPSRRYKRKDIPIDRKSL